MCDCWRWSWCDFWGEYHGDVGWLGVEVGTCGCDAGCEVANGELRVVILGHFAWQHVYENEGGVVEFVVSCVCPHVEALCDSGLKWM